MALPTIGSTVWVEFIDDPDYGRWLVKGQGLVMEVDERLDGVRVLQEDEAMDSHGDGWWIESRYVLQESTESD